ncbi:MAG: rod shape-determining protein MreC [Betaproteobacteria bacterium]
MPLGTLDRTPPPFFRQGLSARTKLVFFAALAVFLMVADRRVAFTPPLREAVALALLPVQRTLAVPVDAVRAVGGYFDGLAAAQAGVAEVEAAMARQAERVAAADRLAAENAQLRGLLELRPAVPVVSRAAEILYEARDPYARKVVLDVGRAQGVQLGAPVIDPRGVLGQVTRLYAITSEVTLLADKDAAIPVLNTRTRQRSAAFGGVQGQGTATMELRFLSGNADIEAGDLLHTSGLDGVYPPGLPVAKVHSVERQADTGFARVLLRPSAPAEGVRHVLVLDPVGAPGADAGGPAASAGAASAAGARAPAAIRSRP